jgi:hypothetical protein
MHPLSFSRIDNDRRIAVKDLTKGSIVSHLLTMAAPLAVSMLTQIAYQLIDLYSLRRSVSSQLQA